VKEERPDPAELLPALVLDRLDDPEGRHDRGDLIISVEARHLLDQVGLAVKVHPPAGHPDPPDAGLLQLHAQFQVGERF